MCTDAQIASNCDFKKLAERKSFKITMYEHMYIYYVPVKKIDH